MEKTIKKALAAVNAEIPFIIGLGAFLYVFMVPLKVPAIGLILYITAEVILFGRLAARLLGADVPRASRILKANIIDYFVAMLFIGGLVLVCSGLTGLAPLPQGMNVMLNKLLPAVVTVVTMYIAPYVFLGARAFKAIKGGVTFFAENAVESTPVIVLIGIKFLLDIAAVFAVSPPIEGAEKQIIFIAANAPSFYVSFLIFAAATAILIENDIPKKTADEQIPAKNEKPETGNDGSGDSAR